MVRLATLLAAGALALPLPALAQTAGRSVLLPPNPIDRATASSDQRNADARRAADADRLNADVAGRQAESRVGPLPQSTMTDTVSGFGTPQETGAPVGTPPRT
jgi:hypothetical protein